MKNKKTLIVVIIAIVILLGGVLLIFKNNTSESKTLKKGVNKTEVSESKGYRMDLRIYGTVNKKSVNEIIMVNNHKDTDKEVTITKILESEKDDEIKMNEEVNTYIIKGNEKYSVKDEVLTKVDNVPYSDTEVYLQMLNNVLNIKEVESESIGEKVYKVYVGVLSASNMNKLIKSTDIDYSTKKDADVTIWEDSDGYIYKIYYKVDGLTIYPSYFGYGTSREINLDMYKNNKA